MIGARRRWASRRAIVAVGGLCVALGATRAEAQPMYACADPAAAKVELAPWFALGAGAHVDEDGTRHAIGDVAMDVGATIPASTFFRWGAFADAGTTNFRSLDTAGGVRLELQSGDLAPESSRFFEVPGRWTVLVDLGLGERFADAHERGGFFQARLAAGFTAPNRLGHLYGRAPCTCADERDGVPPTRPRCRPTLGLVSGVRPFVTMRRMLEDARTEIVAGIEVELIGAGWWLGSL